MIYITGDCHNNYTRFSEKYFPDQKNLTKDDYVIVLGDFGYWLPSKYQDAILDELSLRTFTTLFIDGNHEYFRTNPEYKEYVGHKDEKFKYETGLYDLPTEEWHGGIVHKITDSVIHLTRGQVFDINGLKFFTFGGARSHDIQDGVLNPEEYGGLLSKTWRSHYLWYCKNMNMFRVDGLSWWKEEYPTQEEMDTGIENLKKVGNKVDYILTHDGPQSIVWMYRWLEYSDMTESDVLREYLDDIKKNVTFKKWYFGHHHDNWSYGGLKMLYHDIVELE